MAARKTCAAIELSVKSLKEGWKCGFWSLIEKTCHQELVSSLCVSSYFESWAKLLGPQFHLQSLERIEGPNLGYVHETCCPKFRIDLCRVSLAHPFQWDKLESWWNSLCKVTLASNSWLGTKPMVYNALIYGNSNENGLCVQSLGTVLGSLVNNIGRT